MALTLKTALVLKILVNNFSHTQQFIKKLMVVTHIIQKCYRAIIHSAWHVGEVVEEIENAPNHNSLQKPSIVTPKFC